MMLFSNQLNKLEAENEASFQSLQNTESRREIINMIKYLSASSLSLYQIQIIRKDLTGMAIEGEQNHLSLKEVLGTDPKEFCNEIIQNSGEHARWEHFMRHLLEFLQACAVVYALKFILFNSAPGTFGFDYSDIVWFVVWCIGGIYLPEYISRKSAVNENSYGKLAGWLCRLTAFFSFAVLSNTPLASQFFIRGSGWLIFAVILLLLAGTTAAMNCHWRVCAQRYP